MFFQEKSTPPSIPRAPQQGKGKKDFKDDSVAARLAKLAGKPWWCQVKIFISKTTSELL